MTAVVTGASLNRGRSKQDYGTPWDFIRAVEAKWGPMVHDLASTRENAKAPSGYYYPEVDAIQRSWSADFPTGTDDPYPKDLMLSIFGKATAGFDLWRWVSPRQGTDITGEKA